MDHEVRLPCGCTTTASFYFDQGDRYTECIHGKAYLITVSEEKIVHVVVKEVARRVKL